MARARSIKPSFFMNEELAALPAFARLAFAGLWCLADREGRLEDRPARIKAQIFPYDDLDVDATLSTLAKAGFILRYESQSARYIQVVNFHKHQSPHVKECASTIPAPGSPDTNPPGPWSKILVQDPGQGPVHACAHETPRSVPETSSSTTEQDDAPLEDEAGRGATPPPSSAAPPSPALASAAAQYQRRLSARGRAAAAWQFTPDDLGVLAQAGEALGEAGEELPAAIALRLARSKGDGDGAFDAWFALSAAEVAEWCEKAVAEAFKANKPSVDYVAGIIRTRLNSKDRQPPGTVVQFAPVTAPPPPPKVDPLAAEPWWDVWSHTSGPGLDPQSQLDIVLRRCKRGGWSLDDQEIRAALRAGGPKSAMDLVWAARPMPAPEVG